MMIMIMIVVVVERSYQSANCLLEEGRDRPPRRIHAALGILGIKRAAGIVTCAM